MSGFIIDLAALDPGASHIEARATAGDLELPEAEWSGWVRGHLVVDKTGDKVSVRGRIEAVARLECARCLRGFDLPLDVPLTVFADRSGTARGLEEDLERDHYMKFHDGRRLDLSEEVRESLLLEVPITPHCREGCRGLCPKCGADLNEGPCAHSAPGA